MLTSLLLKTVIKIFCFVLFRFVYCLLFTFYIFLFLSTDKSRLDDVDGKAMIRNRCNRITHPTPDTKRERNTNGTFLSTLLYPI